MPRWLVALVRAPLVLLAWLTRRIVGWLLRVRGYQKTCRLLARMSPSPDPAAGLIRRAGRAWSVVHVALSRDPLRPGECVERSLTLWWLLRWIGVHSVVRSGIRREDGGSIIARLGRSGRGSGQRQQDLHRLVRASVDRYGARIDRPAQLASAALSLIAAYISFAAPADPAISRQMAAAVPWRAPDGLASWHSEFASITRGHTDIGAGCDPDDGPLVCAETGVVLVCDARIDGRRDLLDRLRPTAGHLTSRSSAAALMLAAYRLWGDGFCKHILGDFAFLLFDPRRGKVLIGRDRFGMRSLYYSRTSCGLVVASELRAVLAGPLVDTARSSLAIGDYLLFGGCELYDKSCTPFARILAVRPAECVTVDADGARAVPYWRFDPTIAVDNSRSGTEIVSGFRDVLRSAVSDRVDCADLVVAMSGGLDSTSLAALAVSVRGGGERVTAITAALGGDDAELALARTVAHDLGIAHQGFDVRGFLPFRPWRATSTPSDNAMTDQLREGSRLVATAGRIALTGFAADNVLVPSQDSLLPLIRVCGIGSLRHAVLESRRAFGQAPHLGSGLRRWFSGTTKSVDRETAWPFPDWLAPDLVRAHSLDERWHAWWERRFARRTGAHPQMQFELEWPSWCAENVLLDPGFTPARIVDPFLDLRVVEFVQSIPSLPWLNRKHLLRAAMSGSLPEDVRVRPKKPAGDLLGPLLAGDQNELVSGEWVPSPELAEYVVRDRVPAVASGTAPAERLLAMRPVQLQLWLEYSLPQLLGRRVSVA